jgi:tRNA U34 5-methylaminomethyl-2-thiouridine-forming methyltransferase MnmC
MSNIQIITSADGSSTIQLEDINETYHSSKGALSESIYVFIEKGLKEKSRSSSLTILEIGFGTGLNAFLTYIEAVENNQKIHYHTLEPFPLPSTIIERLNYPELVKEGKFKKEFYILHSTDMDISVSVHDCFELTKHQIKLEDFTSDIKADIVYFDAFAPSKQPELWSLENLEKIKSLMSKDGILVTYCAQGQFKRNLAALGFEVETLEGPPGKKEMTRGRL